MPGKQSPAQLLSGIGRHIYRLLFHENWMIGIVDAPIADSINWKTCPPVRWLGARIKTRYWADPFALPGQEGIIFCEEYDQFTRRGGLVRLTLKDGQVAHIAPFDLPLDGHLSYPFIFSHDGMVYCMPESGAARRLVIFQLQGDGQWREYAAPLTGVAAADGILFRHGDYFWIAYTNADLDRFDNLNLLYAAALDGEWRPHPGNPVRRDARNARCGGTPFLHEGALYRPAQDCSRAYGGALRIMRIHRCTPEAYEEEEVTAIQPEAGENPHGFHTLSAFGQQCLVDGKRMIFSPFIIALKTQQRLRRFLTGKS